MRAERHIVVAASDRELNAAVGAAVQRLANVSLELGPAGPAGRLAGKAAAAAAVLLEVDVRAPGRVEEFRRLARALPESRVVAAVRDAKGEDVRRLFRAGAADVLTPPFTGEGVLAALQEVLHATDEPDRDPGQVIGVLKGCGGAGATTVALNLAAVLARGDARRGLPARRTGVLDLDLQFGDSDVALDLSPRSTVLDVLHASDRLDGRLLRGAMSEHASGFLLLPPPGALAPLEAVTGEAVSELLDHAAGEFERVILDLPAAWTDWTLAALIRCDVVLLVTTGSVGGALGARRVIDALQEAGVRRPLMLVVNRLAGLLDAWEKPARIGQSLEHGVDAGLMLDPAVAKSADRGVLAAEAAPAGRFTRELAALAARLDARLEAMAVGRALQEAAA